MENKKLIEACELLKSFMSLDDRQLAFMAEICYINKGTWNGDVNEALRAEAKREIGLFLKTIKECDAEDLANHFINNGEDEWIIRITTHLVK